MPKVTFVNENVVADVEAGTSIRNAAKSVNINTNLGVNGMGAGINKFVTEGMENTNEPGLLEKKCFNLPFPDPLPALAYTEHPDTMRLACKCTINGDITVETGPEVNLFGDNFFS